jgi:hypothetical protein
MPLSGAPDFEGLRPQQGRRLRHDAGLPEADGAAGSGPDLFGGFLWIRDQ